MGGVTQPADETESITLTLSTASGYSVEVVITYPQDKAILAVQAMREVGSEQYVTSILSELRDDPSVAESLKAAGLAFADDEDDDW